MKRKILLIIIIFSFLSCKKDDNSHWFVGEIEIKGRIYDDHTNEGVPNVTILIDGLSSLGLWNGTRLEVGRTKTNQNGEFSTKIKKIKESTRYEFIPFGNNEYYTPSNHLSFSEEYLENEGKDLSFPAYKYTDFIIELKKVNSTDVIDTLKISWGVINLIHGAFYPYVIEGNQPDLGFRWSGEEIHSTIKTKSIANRETYVRRDLYRNSTHTFHYDTIICERNIVTHFIIEY